MALFLTPTLCFSLIVMENKIWKVYNKGKIQQILIVLGGYIFFGFLILSALGIWRRARINHSFPETLMTVAILSLPIIYIMLKRILKSKSAIMIALNIDCQKFTLTYSEKEKTEIEFSNLAFSIINNNKSRILTFFRTYIGTRGQTVYTEEVEIYGLPSSSAWTLERIDEIVDKLVEVDIEQTHPRSTKLPLWERMISN